MAKALPVEEKLAKLSAIDLGSPAAADLLREALKDKSSLVVTRAAHLVAKADLQSLSDEVESSFKRLMAGGMSADRGCLAKQALAHALYQFGTGSSEVFVAGVQHVQMEPVFGGQADCAAELRGTCALGLVRVGYRDALCHLADLLADPEQQARIMAARALAYSGNDYAVLPLRVKVLSGDKSPEVIGECFAALLRLAPAQSLPLIGRFLDADDQDVAAEAALALGSSRQDVACDLLLGCWKRHLGGERRQILLTPLAMTRRADAIELLVDLIRQAPEALACSAADALGMFRSDPAIRKRVLEAAADRDGRIRAAVAKAVGD